MNERIKELSKQAYEDVIQNTPSFLVTKEMFEEKFAELIIRECTGVLFVESEKLFALYSEEDNWQSAEEYEIRSNQCIDNIAVIEEHFGVEE
jgi:hypothetical protein